MRDGNPSEEFSYPTKSKTSYWYFAKLGILAGSMFGIGYWYAVITKVEKGEVTDLRQATTRKEANDQFAKYEKRKDQIKFTYYKQLTSTPRKGSIDQGSKNQQVSPPSVKSPEIEESQSSDRLANALEKVLGRETPESVANAAKAKLPEVTGSPYALQVASFPDRKIAEELAQKLSVKGYDAKLVQAQIPERGVVYRVRIHGLTSLEEAELLQKKLARLEKLDSIAVAQ